MSGTMHGYEPQWKHATPFSSITNKKFLNLEGGEDWTSVKYAVHRGGLFIRLPDGSEIAVGIPFPRAMPGILETIGFCGEAQAMALAWTFAAYVQAAGGDVEVRAKSMEIVYEMKARPTSPKDSA